LPEGIAGAPGFPEEGDRPRTDPDVLIVTLRTGFPNGMAAAGRIHLIARALALGGARPFVLHMNTSETAPPHRNTEVSGTALGIPFEYAPGRVDRPASFLARRACTVRGFVRTCAVIVSGAASGSLRTVLFYERSIFSLLPLMLLCRGLRIRFALDLVEWPPAMEVGQNGIGRLSLKLYRRIALRAADRVTAISRFLEARAVEIRGVPDGVLHLPILGDEGEIPVVRTPVPGRFVLSISGGYSRELGLALEAFAIAARELPHAELHITGGIDASRLDSLLGSGAAGGADRGILPRVRCRGYISRGDLRDLYAGCCAGVAVLGDDLRSWSRMPTKIAEYAFVGLPLVTAGIGDVAATFSDGESAFLYVPGDAGSLARAMLRAAGGDDAAERVGAAGRQAALDAFSFRRHSDRLTRFLLDAEDPE